MYFWNHLSFAEDDHVGPDLPIVGEHVDEPARLVPKWLIAPTQISVKCRSVISFHKKGVEQVLVQKIKENEI